MLFFFCTNIGVQIFRAHELKYSIVLGEIVRVFIVPILDCLHPYYSLIGQGSVRVAKKRFIDGCFPSVSLPKHIAFED